MVLLAEGDAAPAGGLGNLLALLPAVVLIILIFNFLIVRPEKRRQNEHRRLLEHLKKNDRVVTVGGVYGVVTNVQRDQDSVTLRIDDDNNTKMRVTFSAIHKVLTDDSAGEKSAKSS